MVAIGWSHICKAPTTLYFCNACWLPCSSLPQNIYMCSWECFLFKPMNLYLSSFFCLFSKNTLKSIYMLKHLIRFRCSESLYSFLKLKFKNCVYLRCTRWLLYISSELITTVKLINTAPPHIVTIFCIRWQHMKSILLASFQCSKQYY